MSKVPHELIRQVQISTRAAAGLPDYDPSDPTLPSLPPLSAVIAASDPSLRCKNCKGMLLRGTESIICLYCGLGPHYDAVPEPICFSSTIGYQWLLRSLRLDGSEMIDLSDKKERELGQSSPKSLTRLSEFLDFKIPWPTETEKQESSSDKQLEDSKISLSLKGVAPDKFFLKSKKNDLFDIPVEHSSDPNQNGRKEDLFHNVQSSEPDLFQKVQSSESDLFRNEPAVISSQHKNSEAPSGWAADFQSADTEIQHGGYKSPEPVAGPSAAAEIRFQDHSSSSLQVDLGAHFDSVFGPGENQDDGKMKESSAVSPALDDWNSDEIWSNLSSRKPSYTSAFDSTFTTKNDPQIDSTLEYSKDDPAADDLFQDFQFQTNFTDMTNIKTPNEEHRTMDDDMFDEWNDFTGSTSAQAPPENTWPGINDQVSTPDEKSAERDLFSFDNKCEGGDFGSLSQSNFFPTSIDNSNGVMPENLSSNWLSETSSPALESGHAANTEYVFGQSTPDDVKMLISQTHDLSFMLETDLSILSGSGAPSSSPKD